MVEHNKSPKSEALSFSFYWLQVWSLLKKNRIYDTSSETVTDYNAIANDYKRKLLKAIRHLEYSFDKVLLLPRSAEVWNEEELALCESFSARFARVADLFLSKYIRVIVLQNDPGFSGTLRDFVNQAEKLGIVENANAWMNIRSLRNIASHDYSEDTLTLFFEQLRIETPRLLQIKASLL